jgi:hypothetical protein
VPVSSERAFLLNQHNAEDERVSEFKRGLNLPFYNGFNPTHEVGPSWLKAF